MQEIKVRPFLGVLDGFEAHASNVVVAVPRGIEAGSAQWPGMFWRYCFVHDLAAPRWRAFTSGRLTRLLHFGVRVDYCRPRLIIHPADPNLARAKHSDGRAWPWSSTASETLITCAHPSVDRAIALAVRAYMADPIHRAPLRRLRRVALCQS